ncbi:MAG: AAA family ATPase [Anaerolineales bacterium]
MQHFVTGLVDYSHREAVHATISKSGWATMKTVCLLAQKGGTGKTTLCLHLAVLANELGYDSAIIDIDPQASASAWKNRRQRSSPEVFRHEANDLSGVLTGLKREGKNLVLLDTAPHSSDEAAAAAALADLVLIVSRPAILDLEAIGESVKIVKNKKAPAAVVLNACPPPHRGKETAIVSEAREALDVYGLPVSPVSISQRAAFSHALIDGRSVTEFDSTGKAAGEIRSLFTWLETECDLK